MNFNTKLAVATKLSQCLKKSSESNIPQIAKNLRLSKSVDNYVFYSYPQANLPSGLDTTKLRNIQIENGEIRIPILKADFVSNVLSLKKTDSNISKQLKTIKKCVIEFSSPNIAKPFHIGHFKSTLVGNFIANLSQYYASDVVRINYLGDWGTQFGLLQLGLRDLKIDRAQVCKHPLESLYKAYVKANELAKSNPTVQKQASDIFQKLEQSQDNELVAEWEDFRDFSKNELEAIYNRLNIRFDEYHWESDYAARKIQPIINEIRQIPSVDQEENGLFYQDKACRITLLKSNGSTLYLTRDIAAAYDRFDKYKFDQMIYVTDLSQENHFKTLKNLLYEMKQPWATNIHYVGYGKILGMSTREGKGVFLKDLLDEACDRIYEKQKTTKTTRVSLDNRLVSDTLGISALVVYNLKMRRAKGYRFDWNECLQMNGDGGVKLQYTHCRLVSLENNAGAALPTECDASLLLEPIAFQLVTEIAQFDEVLLTSYINFESSVLVVYLFQLANTIGKALKELSVKNAPPHIASQRLLLFHRARLVLNEGITILGLQPLDKM